MTVKYSVNIGADRDVMKILRDISDQSKMFIKAVIDRIRYQYFRNLEYFAY